MSNDVEEEAVYNKAAELLDGEDFSWIKIIHKTGFLTITQLLALVLHALKNGDQTRDRKKGLARWANKIRDDIYEGQIAIVDHDSHLPTSIPLPQEFYPALSLEEADFLFEEGKIGSSCSKLVEEIFKRKFPEEAGEPVGSIKQDKKEADELAALRIENKKLKAALKGAIEERDNASELFLGAIKHAFKKYDPAKKNDYLSVMKEALEIVNVPRDGDTIKKYLQIGYEKNKNSRKPA
jgi:hypothetical protein